MNTLYVPIKPNKRLEIQIFVLQKVSNLFIISIQVDKMDGFEGEVDADGRISGRHKISCTGLGHFGTL